MNFVKQMIIERNVKEKKENKENVHQTFQRLQNQQNYNILCDMNPITYYYTSIHISNFIRYVYDRISNEINFCLSHKWVLKHFENGKHSR